MSTPTLTLYSRPGCHLCDDARAALERVRARTTFALHEVDIGVMPAKGLSGMVVERT